MASGVAHPIPPEPVATPQNDSTCAEDTPEEIKDFQKIISLRNEIYTGKHPHFKPASILRPAPSDPSAKPSAPAPAPDKNKASLAAWSSNKPPAAPVAGKGHTDDDALIKAETSLQRQQIEQLLKQQPELRKHETGAGVQQQQQQQQVKDGHAILGEDVDVETSIAKWGIRVKAAERADEPQSASKLRRFYGEKAAGASKAGETDTRLDASSPHPAAVGAEGPPATAASSRPTETHAPTKTVESLRERNRRPAGFSPHKRDHAQLPQPPPPPQHPALQPERTQSPQFKYSATSQVRSPAAPQPVRPANMARVESQDRIREIENGGYSGPGDREFQLPPLHSAQAPPKRGRSPPEPHQQPPSPFLRSDYRRPPSPAQRAQSRGDIYHDRPPYDYPATAAHDYRYPQPTPPHLPRYPFEPQPYREDPYAYPPAPIEYRRPDYPPGYPPAPSATPLYYPVGRMYDEYPFATRYPRPPSVYARPLSRGRFGSPPPSAYKRQRRDSRSVSPDRRTRRLSPTSPTLAGLFARRPGGSPAPNARRAHSIVSGAARTANEEERGEAALQRGPEPTAVEYHCPPLPQSPLPPLPPPPPPPPPPPQSSLSRERAYYDSRDPIYGLPPPLPTARYEEAFLPRPDSGMSRRENDWRPYAARNYPSPPPLAQSALPPGQPTHPAPPPPPPPPPPLPPHPAPPPAAEYPRAHLAPPLDALEYSARAEYYSRPEGRDADGRGSRQQSMRPEAAEYYADRSYRAASVRPELERELQRDRYGIPPMQPPPGVGYYGRPPYDEGGYRR